jgi:outer membrane biogenesis lipoprotein LolB
MNARFATTLNLLLALAALNVLAGCASDPRSKQGVEWVTWQDAERQRLQAQGFPQYNHD